MNKIESVDDLIGFSSLQEIYDFFPSSKKMKGRVFEFFCKHLLEGSGAVKGDVGSVSNFYRDDNGIDISYPRLGVGVQCKNWKQDVKEKDIEKIINRIQFSTASHPVKKICIMISHEYSSVDFSYYKNCKNPEILLLDKVGITALMREINPHFKNESNISEEQLEKVKTFIFQFFTPSFSYPSSLQNYSFQKKENNSSSPEYFLYSFLQKNIFKNKKIKFLTSGILGVFILGALFSAGNSSSMLKASLLDFSIVQQTTIIQESVVLPIEIKEVSEENKRDIVVTSEFFHQPKDLFLVETIEVKKPFDLVIITEDNKFIGGSPVFPSQKKVIITPESTAVSFLYIYSKQQISELPSKKIKIVLEEGVGHKKFSELVRLTKGSYGSSSSSNAMLRISVLSKEIMRDVISL